MALPTISPLLHLRDSTPFLLDAWQMSASSIPSVSAIELQSLVSLTQTIRPPFSDMARLLQPFLDITRHKSVRDFVFTPDDIHIPHLISPLFSQSAQACFMRATSIDAEAPPPLRSSLPGESHFIAANVLFVPVCTWDCVTLGVGAMNSQVQMTVPWVMNTAPNHSMNLNLRFARDGESQTMLLVYDAPKDDCFIVYTSTLESSVKARRFTGFFQRQKLREAALGEDGKLRYTDIRGALMLAQEEVHFRECNICVSPPGSCSGCDMTITKPAHLSDHTYFVKGLARHNSSSKAVACKSIFNHGTMLKQTVLGSRQEMGSIFDIRVKEELRRWSMSEYCARMKTDPMESVLLLGEGGGGSAVTHQTEAGMNANSEQDCQLIDIGDVEESPASAAETCLAPMFSGFAQHSEPEDSQLFAMSEPRSDNGNLYEAVFATPSTESHPENFADNGAWEQRGPNIVSARVTGVVETMPLQPQATAQRAQRDTESQNCGIVFRRNEDFSEQELARMVKAEQRKERNRQSARRSNQRNKAKREELKIQIDALKDRIEELRERELELRRENINLRHARDQVLGR